MTEKLREISLLLQSHDEADRRAAIVDMARLRDPRVVPVLQKIAVTDESIRVRYYAKKALTLIRGAAASDAPGIRPKNSLKAPGQINLNALQKGLSDGNAEVRVRTIDAVARFGDPRAMAYLLRRMKVESDKVVIPRLILAFGVLGNEKVVPYLVDFLTAESEDTRAAAAEALGYICHSSAFSYLILSLTDDSQKVRASIIKALMSFGKSRTLQLLKGMLKEKPPRVRLKVVKALCLMKSDEVLPILAVALKDESVDVADESRRIIESFAREGSEMAVRIIESIGEIIEAPPTRIVSRFTTSTLSGLSSLGEGERLSAIHKVMDTNDTDALPMLKEWLELEKNPKVLSKAVLAVGRLGTALDRDFMTPYLVHEDSRVRANCVEALGLMGTEGYEDQVVRFLDDSNNRVRANAIIALKDREKSQTLRALKRMAASVDESDRKSAVFVAADRLFEEDVEILENLLNDVDKTLRKRAFDALKIFRDKGSRGAAVILREIIEGRRATNRGSVEAAVVKAEADEERTDVGVFPVLSRQAPVSKPHEGLHIFSCPECGFENDSWRVDCRKCRAPLRDLTGDIPPIGGQNALVQPAAVRPVRSATRVVKVPTGKGKGCSVPVVSSAVRVVEEEESSLFEGFVQDLKNRSMVGRIGVVSLILFILIYLPLILIMLLQTYVFK